MTEHQYQHESIAKLYELYLEHKKSLGKGISMQAMMWKALAPGIPDLLHNLDEDEDMIVQTRAFLEVVLKAFKADTKKIQQSASKNKESTTQEAAGGTISKEH